MTASLSAVPLASPVIFLLFKLAPLFKLALPVTVSAPPMLVLPVVVSVLKFTSSAVLTV
ncbi:hypothetical protein ACF8M1_07175 [Acinetobacter ursingii]|uniref:hypothetical protein n=1 Tax=Acinetobacter ursingii TaxID=108980 RepID=UPI00370CB793